MVDGSYYSGIPDNYMTPPMTPPKSENRNISIIKELSPQGVLQEMMQQMEGKIWDSVQEKYIKIEGTTPFMNEEGRDTFFHFATAMISSIVTMSNYGREEKFINSLLRYHIKKAIIHFHLHYKDYGINRKTKINILSSKLLILGNAAFRKAIGAGDRKAATSNISESISTLMRSGSPQQEQEANKKGMMRRILGR